VAAQNLDHDWTNMASSGKKKTTMAKLSRESRLRERRLEKKARKELRKQASAEQADDAARLPGEEGEAPADPGDDQPDGTSVARTLAGGRGV
jgi:hypothetical protein